jgi:three-Cys-motif partner protein
VAGRTDKMGTVWPLEPHTQAKHELLRHYLGAWYAILSKRGRVIVLDGFAGPGVYAGGEDGSPRIVLSTLLSHNFVDGMGDCEFQFAFNEQDRERYEVLEAEIEQLRSDVGGWPDNVKVQHFNQSFPVLAQDILESLGGQPMAPLFAFLDPFGYRDVLMKLIAQLMQFQRSELFIYFDFNSVNRFSTAGIVDEHFESLFGTDEFRDAPAAGRGRHEFLRSLYGRQLRDKAKFRYVQHFEMVNATGHTGNYLFFCTRNLTGLDKMKAAMWKVAPAGNFQFDDRHVGQISIMDEADTTELREQLIERLVVARGYWRTMNSSGITSSVVPFETLCPSCFAHTAPVCLKKNATPRSAHWSRMSRTQAASIDRAPWPDSPPTMTQSSPEKSTVGSGPRSGSSERNRTAAGVSRSLSARHAYRSSSMDVPSHTCSTGSGRSRRITDAMRPGRLVRTW